MQFDEHDKVAFHMLRAVPIRDVIIYKDFSDNKPQIVINARTSRLKYRYLFRFPETQKYNFKLLCFVATAAIEHKDYAVSRIEIETKINEIITDYKEGPESINVTYAGFKRFWKDLSEGKGIGIDFNERKYLKVEKLGGRISLNRAKSLVKTFFQKRIEKQNEFYWIGLNNIDKFASEQRKIRITTHEETPLESIGFSEDYIEEFEEPRERVKNLLAGTSLSIVFDDISKDIKSTKKEDVTPDPMYYAGTNATWRHIKSGQDVIRKSLIQKIFGHLYRHNICVIKSESGQGKTTLMYRTAYEYRDLFHIFQVKYLDKEKIRLTELELPGISRKTEKDILILVDDITRFSNWEIFLDRFKQREKLFLLMTTREDEWDNSKIKGFEGHIEFVEPKLDYETANLIYNSLSERKLAKTKEWTKAFDESRGRLLEYVTFLTQSVHLKKILETQLGEIKKKKLLDEQNVLRIVVVLHNFGGESSLDLLHQCTKIPLDKLAACIENLKEFIIKVGKDRYEGLHELRSRYIMELLHVDYPLKSTVQQIFKSSRLNEMMTFLTNMIKHQPDVAKSFVDDIFEILQKEEDLDNVASFLRNIPVEFINHIQGNLKILAHSVARCLNARQSLYELTKFIYSILSIKYSSPIQYCSEMKSNPLTAFIIETLNHIEISWILPQMMTDSLENRGMLYALSSLDSKLTQKVTGNLVANTLAKEIVSTPKQSYRDIDNYRTFLEGIHLLNPSLAHEIVSNCLTKETILSIIKKTDDFFGARDFICITLKNINKPLALELLLQLVDHFESCISNINSVESWEWLSPREESKPFAELSSEIAETIENMLEEEKKHHEKCPVCGKIVDSNYTHECADEEEKNYYECPKCGEQINIDEIECSECGWTKDKKKESSILSPKEFVEQLLSGSTKEFHKKWEEFTTEQKREVMQNIDINAVSNRIDVRNKPEEAEIFLSDIAGIDRAKAIRNSWPI